MRLIRFIRTDPFFRIPGAYIVPAWLATLVVQTFSQELYLLVTAVWMGITISVVLPNTFRHRRMKLFERKVEEQFPKTMHAMEAGEDGSRTITAEMRDGRMVAIQVPNDYHPAKDNFAFVLRELGVDEEILMLAQARPGAIEWDDE